MDSFRRRMTFDILLSEFTIYMYSTCTTDSAICFELAVRTWRNFPCRHQNSEACFFLIPKHIVSGLELESSIIDLLPLTMALLLTRDGIIKCHSFTNPPPSPLSLAIVVDIRTRQLSWQKPHLRNDEAPPWVHTQQHPLPFVSFAKFPSQHPCVRILP